MSMQSCVQVGDGSQVGEARRAAARLAQTLPLSDSRRSDAAIVATELATNLARHATHGRLLLQALRSSGAEWLELMAIDGGPGIPDLPRVLQDGHSSGGTLGTGFGAVRRLSDAFDVFSTPGKGTVVLSRIRTGAAPVDSPFVVGATSLPAPHEDVCGDAWRVAERGRDLALLVADGLGHGALADEAARRAVTAFEQDPFDEDQSFFDRAHRTLGGSRGAAAARAVVTGADLRYAGIGNIAGSLIAPDVSRGLPSQNGTVGVDQRRKVNSSAYRWPERGLLLMHSDGISSRWSVTDYPGLIVRHPAVIAAVIARDFTRGRDDATAVVVSATGKG